MTLSQTVELSDSDIIKLIEEYLANRQLDIALLCLERESGIINGAYSEDGLFLRQLILDGHWDDVLEFLHPLEGIEGYDKKHCLYLIYKHKFLELLCIKLDPGPLQNHEFTLDEVINCLTELEQLCTDRKEYDNLCFLLTLPSITSDQNYKNWNPSSARINCFNELYPLVKKFIGLDKRPPANSASKHDRLVNLLAKGLLYEMCVELCTVRACGTSDDVTINHLLAGAPCSDADLSLVTWLQKVPSGTLAIPFEKKSFKLKTDRLDKPLLEAVWSEQLLAAPIKPKKFPHTSIPARTRSSQIISQSMMAMYDGLSSNLFSPHGMRGSMSEPKRHLAASTHLSRSYAHAPTNRFLLTNSFSGDRRGNPMNQSMEQLFNRSSHTSPRPQSTSPLVKHVKSEAISPGVADISPTFFHTPTTSDSHTLAGSVTNQPRSPNHSPSQSRADRQSQPMASQTPDHRVTKSISRDNHPSMSSTPNAHPQVYASQSNPPASTRHDTELPSKQQTRAVQKPDILQHDVRDSRTVSSSHEGDIGDGVQASQDLYAQYQQQKKRIEEEMRLMEQRDEKWKLIHSDAQLQQQLEDSIPKLDLNQSVSFEAHADTSQQVPHHDTSDVYNEGSMMDDSVTIKQFVAVETLEEQGPVRAVAFHPTGECYAVGSNTKILRICQYPDMSKVTTSYHSLTKKPKILAKKVKHHAGSIYCAAWNTLGTVIATGSNDHTVKCVQWLSDQNVFGSEKSLSVHDGTVRDVTFLSTDQLLSAGAGDCTVCLTDIASGMVVRRYKGHDGHVLSLYTHRESQKFVSGGQDKKALMWDTRMSVPVQTYQSPGTETDSAFASVCVDPAPRVLASGHDNSYCSLFDLRQGRLLQAWKPHTDEVRSARFNFDATYFLSGSYDTTVKLMDMQGDITQPLKTVQVAEHMDKVIQCRWHPLLPSFVTSSADKTVTCWAIQIDDL